MMEPWPPPGPGDRQPLARRFALWRDPAVRARLRRVRRQTPAGSPVAAAGPASALVALAPTRDPILHGGAAVFWRRGVAGVRLASAARALSRAPVLTRIARID
ncbi:MAG: hypothetical protein HYT86_04435 [candidate division NC10 bacterium]|nr:hypothetical protein [candidate division NC10 bacterium]